MRAIRRRAAEVARLRRRIRARRRRSRRQRPLSADQRGRPRQRQRTGSVRPFQFAHRCGRGRIGVDGRSVCRRRSRRQGLWPGHLRHERRPRRVDDRDRGDPRGGYPLSGCDRDFGYGRRGVRWLRRRRLSRNQGILLEAARSSRHHSRATQRRSRVHRSSRRMVGRGRDVRPHRARLDAVPR